MPKKAYSRINVTKESCYPKTIRYDDYNLVHVHSVHWIREGKELMLDGTYLSRNFATLGPLT